MRTIRPTPALLIAASLAFVASCATDRLVAPYPLYDFNTVFLNDDMASQKPWKAIDREAITTSLRDAEQRAKARAKARRASRKSARTSPRVRSKPAPPSSPSATPVRSYTPPPPPAATTSDAGAGSGAHADTSDVADFEQPVPPKRIPGLILGDGSVGGELVAAASRLVGLGPSMGPNAFLQHLQKTAAVAFDDARSGQGGVSGTWLALHARQLTYEPGERSTRPGDLVFFHHVADLNGDGETDAMSGVGVVEQVVDDETVVCIMPALGAVRRVPASPQRASVRRDGDRVLNVPIRPRRSNEGPDRASLSGQLVAGFARL